MYLDTIAEQSRNFLYSCGFGFLLGMLFDVFEFLGEFFPKRKSIIIVRDIIYMIECAFLIFLFNLAVGNGSFKFYIYAGAAMGWFIYYFSVGNFTRRIVTDVSALLKHFFKRNKSRFLVFVNKFKEKRRKKCKKSKISSNLLLQDEDLLLYNKKDN